MHWDWALAGTCLLIIVGRIADVGLGTVRTIFVVQGRRATACVLGFFEVLIWISVVARVIGGLHENLVLAVTYAFGFAIGNYVGITAERWLAFGKQVLVVISRQGGEIAEMLRQQGIRLTEFPGEGRDGPTRALVVVVDRRESPRLIAQAQDLDRDCFYVLEDIRLTSAMAAGLHQPTGWRAILKKK